MNHDSQGDDDSRSPEFDLFTFPQWVVIFAVVGTVTWLLGGVL